PRLDVSDPLVTDHHPVYALIQYSHTKTSPPKHSLSNTSNEDNLIKNFIVNYKCVKDDDWSKFANSVNSLLTQATHKFSINIDNDSLDDIWQHFTDAIHQAKFTHLPRLCKSNPKGHKLDSRTRKLV